MRSTNESKQRHGDSGVMVGAAPTFVKNVDHVQNRGDLKFGGDREDDPIRIEQRSKQILFGKNTVGYDNYISCVPKEKRKKRPEHPSTPDVYEKLSKRDFDGRIKAWRRGLHLWDNLDQRPDQGDRQPKRKRGEMESIGDMNANLGSAADKAIVSAAFADQPAIDCPENSQASRSSDVKRRRIDESGVHQSIGLDTEKAQQEEEPPKFSIGEDVEDGYESEDVL